MQYLKVMTKKVPVRATGSYDYDDFITGHRIDTEPKMKLYDLVAQHSGGWGCLANKYESNSFRAQGMRKSLLQLLDHNKLEEKAYDIKVENPKMPLTERVEKTLKALGGNLSNQMYHRFEDIYALFDGSRVLTREEQPQLRLFNDRRGEVFNNLNNLNRTFNLPKENFTKSTRSDRLSKTKLLPIAVEINKLLEPLDKEERDYVLGV